MIPERIPPGPAGSGRRPMLRLAGETVEPARSAPSPYWLIARHDDRRVSVFTLRFAPGEEALPVFGHAEEAGTFLRLSGLKNGWEIRETGPGEIVSVLLGLCKGVQKVVLDPPPEPDLETWIDLMSVGRRVFIEVLMGAAETAAS